MQEFLKADIFFFIASVATVAFTGALVMALVYAIRILQKVDVISGTVQQEVKNIAADVERVRTGMKRQSAGGVLAGLITTVLSFLQAGKKPASKRSRSTSARR